LPKDKILTALVAIALILTANAASFAATVTYSHDDLSRLTKVDFEKGAAQELTHVVNGHTDTAPLQEGFELIISEAGVFDDGFKSIRVDSVMVWDGYSMSAVRHAGMLTPSYYPESDFGKGPYRSFGRDIRKEHLRPEPLFHKQGNPLSLLRSYGGRF
jgi:hypothetical protein